jgi:hypothetical protein
MNLLDKLERKVGWLAFPHLLPMLVFGQLIVYIAVLSGMVKLDQLMLFQPIAAKGEFWRFFTFMVTPEPRLVSNNFFFIISLFFTWYVGSALEREWGLFRFTLYFLMGWVSLILVSFTPFFQNIYFIETYVSNAFLMGSLILAFARLFPHAIIRLFFVLPVEAKILGWITWGFYLLGFATGDVAVKLEIAASLLPFIILFAPDILLDIKARKRRQTFQKDVRSAKIGVRHTCSKCGATDESDPDRTFRYGKGDVCVCDVCLNKGESS